MDTGQIYCKSRQKPNTQYFYILLMVSWKQTFMTRYQLPHALVYQRNRQNDWKQFNDGNVHGRTMWKKGVWQFQCVSTNLLSSLCFVYTECIPAFQISISGHLENYWTELFKRRPFCYNDFVWFHSLQWVPFNDFACRSCAVAVLWLCVFVCFQTLFMSNRQKIEQQTNLLNSEWSKLRIQSIPVSTCNGAQANKKVCSLVLKKKTSCRKRMLENCWIMQRRLNPDRLCFSFRCVRWSLVSQGSNLKPLPWNRCQRWRGSPSCTRGHLCSTTSWYERNHSVKHTLFIV